MHDKVELESADRPTGPQGDVPAATPKGPGRWLLTLVAIFGVVFVAGAVMVVGAFIVAG